MTKKVCIKSINDFTILGLSENHHHQLYSSCLSNWIQSPSNLDSFHSLSIWIFYSILPWTVQTLTIWIWFVSMSVHLILHLYNKKKLIRFCSKKILQNFFSFIVRHLNDWLLVYLSRSYSKWYHLRIFWTSKLMPLCFLVGGKSWRLKSLRK